MLDKDSRIDDPVVRLTVGEEDDPLTEERTGNGQAAAGSEGNPLALRAKRHAYCVDGENGSQRSTFLRTRIESAHVDRIHYTCDIRGHYRLRQR